MKKYFPGIIFILVFSGFLIFQIVADQFSPMATFSTEEKRKALHYSQEFKNSSFTSIKQEVFRGKENLNDIVVINFWATWCLPCLEEIPTLNALSQKLNHRVKVIGVNTGDDIAQTELEKFISKNNIKYPIVRDTNDQLTFSYDVSSSLPETIIFVKGKFYRRISGKYNFEDKKFIKELESLL